MSKIREVFALLVISIMFLAVVSPTILLGYWLGGPIGGLCLLFGDILLIVSFYPLSKAGKGVRNPKPV